MYSQLKFPFSGPEPLSPDECFAANLNAIAKMMDRISPNWREGLRELNELNWPAGSKLLDK
jgi:hypothetical protein